MPNIAFNTDRLTTNTGAPIVSNKYSLRAGNRGMALHGTAEIRLSGTLVVFP